MAFTAKDVQALREKTGVGMMDCKKALTAADGDMDKAIDFLREKGLAAAAKKSGRIAAEGVVLAYSDEEKNVGVLIEVNSETDFVGKNPEFQGFVKDIAKTVASENPKDVDSLLKMKLAGSDRTVEDNLHDKILKIGENIKIRRFERVEGVTATYIHGGGRIGVMVHFDVDPSKAKDEAFKELGLDIAMQIAALNPLYLDKNSVPKEVIEHEKKILTEQVINEGKPANIAEKIVMGKLGKYYKENCLLDQQFVKNGDINVAQYIKEKSSQIGCPISVKSYVRFERGEGMQKKEENFADEVKGMIK